MGRAVSRGRTPVGAVCATLLITACGARSVSLSRPQAGSQVDAGPVREAPPPLTPPACDPEAGGPYWLDEGESILLTTRCATGLHLPGEAFAFSPLPDGALHDPAGATLKWTPGLDQAAVWRIKVEVRRLGESGEGVVGVADRFWDPANAPVRDPAAYTEEHGLPVFHVRFLGTPGKSVPIPAQVTYRGRVWSAELKLHGVSSLTFPKKSHGLRFPKEDLFSDPDRGFEGRAKLRLITTFDDNSYVRQRLGFDLWNRLDPAHLRIKAFPAVVFLNGRYFGLYLVCDDVDRPLLRQQGFGEDGNLYKAVSNDANFGPLDRFGAPKESPHQGFEKKEGEPPQDFSDLDSLLETVLSASGADFARAFPAAVRLEDHQHWWVFVCALLASDNARKNYYLFHDGRGGPWRFAPWDLNATFGQTWRTLRESPRARDWTDDNGLFARLLTDPELGPATRARLRDALSGPWALGEVLRLFDAHVAEVRGAALRDQILWGETHRAWPLWRERTDLRDFEGEVVYVREWIRAQWTRVAASSR